MNATIELHDSTLSAVDRDGPEVIVRLRPAYVHRAEGRPGVDPGTGWLVAVDLVIRGTIIDALPTRLPGVLADGDFSIGPERWENGIPLPPPSDAGAVVLSAVTEGSEVVSIRGLGAEARLIGGARFVEAFLPHQPLPPSDRTDRLP